MAFSKVELDHDGIAEVLTSSEMAQLMHDTAEAVASNVNVVGEVVVDDYTTDRAASSVTIRDVRGRTWQVRDGVLTRAALAEGLEVTER